MVAPAKLTGPYKRIQHKTLAPKKTSGHQVETTKYNIRAGRFHKSQNMLSDEVSYVANNKEKLQTADRPRNRVSFSERVKVRKTLHINNYTTAECESCWFSDSEFAEIRENLREVISLINDGLLDCKDNENALHCRRGVEMHTDEKDALARKYRRRAIRWAVLDGLELQKEKGIYTPDIVAQLYGSASEHAVLLARRIAEEDELNAYI